MERWQEFDFVREDRERGPAFDYVRKRSTAGFIYPSGGEQKFFSLRDGVDRPPFMPRDCKICSSTQGLLLCHYPRIDRVVNIRAANQRRRYSYVRIHFRQGYANRRVPYRYGYVREAHLRRYGYFMRDPSMHRDYLICNPYHRELGRAIRNPPGEPHPADIPRVLVVCSMFLTTDNRFKIVCIVPVPEERSNYFFEVYSSKEGSWERVDLSTPEGQKGVRLQQAIPQIRIHTGVACRAKAYWLTNGIPEPCVVYYDTETRAYGAIAIPDFFNLSHGLLQLGECQGNLYLAGDARRWRAVFMLSNGLLPDDGQVWEERYRHLLRNSRPVLRNENFFYEPSTLSRFHDTRLQIPLWFDEAFEGQRKLFIEDCTEGEQPPLTGEWDAPALRDYGDNILPLVRTNLRPIHHFNRRKVLYG